MMQFDDDFIVLSEAFYSEILLEIARDHNVPYAIVLDIVTDFNERMSELTNESDREIYEYL